MNDNEILNTAKTTLNIEIRTLNNLHASLDSDFIRTVKLCQSCQGRVVISGLGKSGLIGQKISATLNSIGCHSLFMHATEAIHGDLGMIMPEDILLILSKSGETPEIKALITHISQFSNIKIAITSNPNSFLAQKCNHSLLTPIDVEADPNNLVPTSSTISQLALGDAIAACLIKLRKFSPEDFATYHPGGNLGKKLLLTIEELIISKQQKPYVKPQATVDQVLKNISQHRKGATVVLHNDQVKGIITDGDIRRMLMNIGFSKTLVAQNIMSTNPKMLDANTPAVKALEFLETHNISQVIVMKENTYFGIVHLHDILDEGLKH